MNDIEDLKVKLSSKTKPKKTSSSFFTTFFRSKNQINELDFNKIDNLSSEEKDKLPDDVQKWYYNQKEQFARMNLENYVNINKGGKRKTKKSKKNNKSRSKKIINQSQKKNTKGKKYKK